MIFHSVLLSVFVSVIMSFNLTDPEVVYYRSHDNKLINFVEYLKQCEKYWAEQESNQTLAVIDQTHNYTLPQPLKFMTLTQYPVLLNNYLQHTKKMLLL